jgi:hypothetical protein
MIACANVYTMAVKSKRTVSEIKSIISICREQGVDFLKFDDFEIRFGDLPQKHIEVSIPKEEKDDNMEDALQDLILTDPVAYEEALNHREG